MRSHRIEHVPTTALAREPDRVRERENAMTRPEKNEIPAMSPAELQTTREFLGLSTSWIAEKLVINKRRLVRMESGQEPSVPQAIITLLDEIHDETLESVERMVAANRRKAKASTEPVVLLTYRTDKDYLAAGGKYPARWHRHICARVADAVPNTVLMYTEPESPDLGVNVGERVEGLVTNTTDFGAFVSLRPGLDGLIHVSELDPGKRVVAVEDYVQRGDTVEVEIIAIDCNGRVNLRLVRRCE
jgi:hypothetical protein